ncbi:MAG: hypothetical protein ISR65_14965 [Bacteriovoracaceae bacterium]|nr:hypothetical protein [Bacteriovoracaceae bacterium]
MPDEQNNLFMGDLGQYRKILTGDGSNTLWSEYFDETNHSTAGAKEETEFLYLQGCKIAEIIQLNKRLNLLDVGFGMGLSFTSTLQLLTNVSASTASCINFNYCSIELDQKLVQWVLNNHNFSIFKSATLISKDGLRFFEATSKNFNMKIFIGDGTKTLRQAKLQGLLPKFDAIYQDPFSPKKNPALWTCSWFEFLKSISNQNVHLSTYSVASSVHKALEQGGWTVFKKKGFGKKRFSTYACLQGL